MVSTSTATGETSSADRVRELVRMVNSLAKQVKTWQETQGNAHSEAVEALESRVSEIGSELDAVSSRMKTFDGMPGTASKTSLDAAEIPVLERLSVRVARLEKWIARLNDRFKQDASLARKQLIISLATLVAAAVFFGVTIWFALGG